MTRNEKSEQIISWSHWFVFFNALIAVIIGFSYVAIDDTNYSVVSFFYTIITILGHLSFLAFIFFIVFIFPACIFIRSHTFIKVLSFISAIIIQLLLFIDILFYNEFKLHLNSTLAQLLFKNAGNLLFDNFIKITIFFFIIIFIEYFFAKWSFKKIRSLNKRIHYFKLVTFFLGVCFFSSHFIYIWSDAHFYKPITSQRSLLPLSHPLTAKTFLLRYGLINKSNFYEKQSKEGDISALSIQYPLSPIDYAKNKNSKNILFIMVENWRDNNLENLPTINHLAKKNINFKNHYSTSIQSKLAEFSIFYGLTPNYYPNVLASHKTTVLFDILIKQNYQLGLFSFDDFNHPFYKYALLTDFSLDENSILTDNHKLTEQWLSWREQQIEKPWFSLIKFQINNKPNQLVDLDADIKKLLSTISLDDTIVIFTANAPHLLNEHDLIDSENLRVPLVIALDDKEAKEITLKTSHLDIMQTLMTNILNVKTQPKEFSLGRDLFVNKTRNWLFAGSEKELTAFNDDKMIKIDNEGRYHVFYQDKNIKRNQDDELSLFLQIITENRRFYD